MHLRGFVILVFSQAHKQVCLQYGSPSEWIKKGGTTLSCRNAPLTLLCISDACANIMYLLKQFTTDL